MPLPQPARHVQGALTGVHPWLPILSDVGVVCFAVSCGLLHVIQPELNPLHHAVSYYMNGDAGWLLGTGLAALGAGSLALTAALSRSLGPARTRAGRWSLAVWGAGALLGGIFAPDPMGRWDQPPSTGGLIHMTAAMVAFLAFPVAALRLSGRLGAMSRSSALGRALMAVAAGGVMTLILFFVCLAPVVSNRPPVLLGLVERLLLVWYLAWLVMATMAVRRSVGPNLA